MKSHLLKRSRRPFVAAGALFWASMTLALSQCLKIEDTRVACITDKPTASYTVSLKVTNLTKCTVPWITFHPEQAFTPNIIELSTALSPGSSSTINTTLNGIVPGASYTFTILTHCYQDGSYCEPCRQEVTLTLPKCEPTKPVRPKSPAIVGLTKDRFLLSLPSAPNQRQIIEASEDMVTWETVAFSISADGEATTAEIASTESKPTTVWLDRSREQRRRYYRVRQEP